MKHEKNLTSNTCLPAPRGWAFDAGAGALSPLDPGATDARGLWSAEAARGGQLGAAARDILAAYGMHVMGGFAYTVPLHAAHVQLRGTPDLDCIHYCHAGVPEIMLYELARTLAAGAGGVQAQPEPADAGARRACVPLGAFY